jgi:hypothetical protein
MNTKLDCLALGAFLGVIFTAVCISVIVPAATKKGAEPAPATTRAPFRVVREFYSMREAAAYAREGDTIEIAPGSYSFGGMVFSNTFTNSQPWQVTNR